MENNRYPDFLGIGAQKSGTTWLHNNLTRHPDVWMPRVKELQYFNDLYFPEHRKWTAKHRTEHARRALNSVITAARDDKREVDLNLVHGIAEIAVGTIGDDWYGRVFAHAGKNQICGEITPEYGLLPRAGVAHVRKLNPNVRVMFLMRDPIERSWSHIRMLARTTPATDLMKVVEYPDIQNRGGYPRIIDDWTRAFGAQNVFLEFTDTIAERPYDVLKRVCEFLGIDYVPKAFTRAEDRIHIGEAMEMPDAVHVRLKEQLRPVYDEMAERFPEPAKAWRAKHYG